MSDLSPAIAPAVAARLVPFVDLEGKLPRAIEDLGPVSGRDVLVLGAGSQTLAMALERIGARLRTPDPGPSQSVLPDVASESVDVLVGMHSVFRGVDPAEQAEADRVLRPDGRLILVHDYGRDDVGELLPPDLPELTEWGRRSGPFLRAGFRVRVIHCWWSFETLDQARDELVAAFGERGATVAERLKRPRLSHNLALYHRDRGAG